MNTKWQSDPRLKVMSPQKLSLLTEFAKKVEMAPKNQLVTTLLTLNMEAKEKGLQFTDEETELLVSILSGGMNATEQKRLETLRMLSSNLTKRK